jgi:hypothetical protein
VQLDHILSYYFLPRPEETPPDVLVSAVVRCPVDSTLLEKKNPDPYIHYLRGLEEAGWAETEIDPGGELKRFVSWTPEVIDFARRFMAMGITFHPSELYTFAVLGITLRVLAGDGVDDYLNQCARDFSLDDDVLMRLSVEFGQSIDFAHDLIPKHQALMVARQWIRSALGKSP